MCCINTGLLRFMTDCVSWRAIGRSRHTTFYFFFSVATPVQCLLSFFFFLLSVQHADALHLDLQFYTSPQMWHASAPQSLVLSF